MSTDRQKIGRSRRGGVVAVVLGVLAVVGLGVLPAIHVGLEHGPDRPCVHKARAEKCAHAHHHANEHGSGPEQDSEDECGVCILLALAVQTGAGLPVEHQAWLGSCEAVGRVESPATAADFTAEWTPRVTCGPPASA